MLELSAAQVAGNLTQVGAPHLLHGRLRGGFLGQNNLAGDVLDIPIAEHHLHREAPHQPLQVGHARQGRLACTHKEELAVEVLGQGLGDFLYLEGFFGIGADELLDLVQNHQGQREVSIGLQSIRDGGGHLVAGDVGDLRELLLEQLAGVGLGMGQVRAGFEQGLGEVAGHVHVWQFLRQRATCGQQFGFHLGQ